jgi:hypothetical protein
MRALPAVESISLLNTGTSSCHQIKLLSAVAPYILGWLGRGSLPCTFDFPHTMRLISEQQHDINLLNLGNLCAPAAGCSCCRPARCRPPGAGASRCGSTMPLLPGPCCQPGLLGVCLSSISPATAWPKANFTDAKLLCFCCWCSWCGVSASRHGSTQR